jgi:hypothetical protein
MRALRCRICNLGRTSIQLSVATRQHPGPELPTRAFAAHFSCQQALSGEGKRDVPEWQIRLGDTQLVDACTESRPIAPEYGQDGTCAARPISSITCTKTVQLRNS